MLTRISLLCVSLLLPQIALADTIVTWVGEGTVTGSYHQFPNQMVPPVGTPFSLIMTFDPTQAFPHPNPQGLGENCMIAPGVSSSLNLGGYIYNGSNNLGFTNAMLPGTNCSESGLTQFSLHNTRTPSGAPWNLNDGGILILSYRDLLVQDAFPSAPTTPLASLWYDSMQGPTWGFRGTLSLAAVEQPAPVPEPGTLTLFGLGLAAVVRRRRRA